MKEIGQFRVAISQCKCELINMTNNTLYSHENKTLFHKKDFALFLILKVIVLRTWKWPTESSLRGHASN